jgi:glycine betaine/proline transport system permease protein
VTATITPPPAPAAADKEAAPIAKAAAPRRTGLYLLVICAVWGVGYLIFKDHDTLARPYAQLNSLDTWFNHRRDDIVAAGQTNWFFHGVIGHLSSFVNSSFGKLQDLLSQPSGGRPVPTIGWLGVVAIFGWLALALAGLRSALMVIGGTLLFGILGYWQDSVDTVIMTVLAVIASIVVGVPVGIAMARRRWVSKAITPVLDVMQTMPSFAYLPFFFVLFGPGVTCAIMLTIVYSIPPLVRITEHGLRSVSETTVEAAGSLGVTRRQLLRKVQLPMARRTIIVGVNQCTLAALSMVVIAAFVDGPGLGKDVLTGLTNLDVGGAAVPGLLIVVIAIVLDRTTTAASERRERTQGRLASVSGPGLMLTSVVLERLPRWASEETRTRRLPSSAWVWSWC